MLGTLRLFKVPEDHTVIPGPSAVLTALTGASGTPAPTASPLPTPSPLATLTPAPTASITPSPSLTPTASPSPPPASLRDGWGGSFFPAGLPDGFALSRVYRLEEAGLSHHGEFTNESGARLTFSEYETPRVVETGPGDSGFHYVKLNSGPIALVSGSAGGGACVVWDQGGRTLEVYAATGSDDALALAASVQKIE